MSRPVSYRAFLLFAATGLVSAHGATDASAPKAQKYGAPPPGFHDLKLPNGSSVRVADQTTHSHVAALEDDGKYDPENADFSRTSSFANKEFSTGFAALSKNDTAAESRENKRFATGVYSTHNYDQAGRPFQTVAYNDATKISPDLNKPYALPTAFDSNHTFDTGKKSEFQDKQALIAQQPAKVDPFAAPGELTEKAFFDPNLTKVKRDPYAAASGLDVSRLTNLPNRPLTIDEVRNLINHDQVPDLKSKPDAPSRPLNDPNWTPPETAPPAPVIDDRPLRPGPTTEDKSDDLPSPGMMAEPASGAKPPAK